MRPVRLRGRPHHDQASGPQGLVHRRAGARLPRRSVGKAPSGIRPEAPDTVMADDRERTPSAGRSRFEQVVHTLRSVTLEASMTHLIHLRHLALGAIRDPHWVGATTGHR